ncbi:TIGR00341 family protein, partial [Nocardia sp. NPDC003648]
FGVSEPLVLTVAGVAASYVPMVPQVHLEPEVGRAYLVLGAALVLVAIPMVINSLSTLWARQIADATRDWLGDAPGAQVIDVTLQGDIATVSVLGPQQLPPVAELQDVVDDLVPFDPKVIVVHTVGARLED